MSADSDDETRYLALAGERDIIVNRLTRALGAIDRKRRAITHLFQDVAALVPRSPDAPGTAGRSVTRSVLVGAVAGGLVVAVALLVQHRRRERRRPTGLLRRAWFTAVMPPTPSRLSGLVREAAGSLLMSVASAAARAILTRALEAAEAQRGPETLNRLPEVPGASFVRSPGSVAPTAGSSDNPLARPVVASLPPLPDFA